MDMIEQIALSLAEISTKSIGRGVVSPVPVGMTVNTQVIQMIST
jgi:hypothetical protein